MIVEYIYDHANDVVGKMEVYHLSLVEEKVYKAVLVNTYIYKFGDIQLFCFNSDELSALNKYSAVKRRNEYVLGRYSMKTAISHISDNRNKRDIEIEYGILHYPVIKNNLWGIEVGLSHCESRAIAVAYDNRNMLGIDIETVDKDKSDALNKITLPKEKELFYNLDMASDTFLTVLWTAKEALAKAIKTGFTCDMEIFKISNIKRYQQDYLVEYANFPAFQGLVKVRNKYVTTLAYIKKIDISCFAQKINI